MGSDVWMRPLGPVAAEGAAWLHFHSVAEALRFLHSEAKHQVISSFTLFDKKHKKTKSSVYFKAMWMKTTGRT